VSASPHFSAKQQELLFLVLCLVAALAADDTMAPLLEAAE